MNKKTLKALKGSIKKWEKIVNSTRALDKGTDNCPLCKIFYDFITFCEECPVKEKTKIECCKLTPYTEWADHFEEKHQSIFYSSKDNYRIKGCDECLKLAKKELNFLINLLPVNEKKLFKIK